MRITLDTTRLRRGEGRNQGRIKPHDSKANKCAASPRGSTFSSVTVPSVDKDTHGFDGQKNVHTSSKTLKIHKVFPAAFSSSGRLPAPSKLLAPYSDGFSCDFWLLRRRCVVTHQDEKARPFSRTPSKAQRSGFVRKKEEGESIMEFSPQGGNGMARTSSDAVRRMCSCLPRVIRFIIYSAAARNNSQHNYKRRGGVEWQSPAEVKN